MTAPSYSHSWRIRTLDAAAYSSDPARNARAWAAGWTPPGYALYAARVAACVRYSTQAIDTASECGHVPQHKVA